MVFTTENATRRFYPMFVVIKVTAANTIALVPTISMGTNASSYDNILTGYVLTNLSAVNKMVKADLSAVAIDSVAPNTGIYVNITSAATASTCTLSVTLVGYYE